MITTDDPEQANMLREAMNKIVQAQLPAEKAQVVENQTKIAQQLHAEGSRRINGLGQKIGSIDARTYFRHHQENPGCMQDPGYIQQLLRDSPKLRAPGYQARTPRRPTYTLVYK